MFLFCICRSGELNLDEWTEEDVDNVIKLGVIEAVNSKYEDNIPENRKKPQPDSSIEKRSDFIRRKYVLQQFLNMEEQLSCPFNPAAFNCSSTCINSVVEKKFCSNILMYCCCSTPKNSAQLPKLNGADGGLRNWDEGFLRGEKIRGSLNGTVWVNHLRKKLSLQKRQSKITKPGVAYSVITSDNGKETMFEELAMEATRNDGRLARIPLKNRAKEVEAHQFLLLRFNQIIGNYNASLEGRMQERCSLLENFSLESVESLNLLLHG
ncbi:hypothetical protein L2E82_23172 [Cichorium intybus]|uniref:Uncharacterized protein n=1 Tax=Cichorium intybus TaxID=13427 RepID=A0ACB9E0R9_CICIN|nr:hypothetical protein L2E82_23172 [Cichorium intybus]